MRIIFNRFGERNFSRGKLFCIAMMVLMTISFTPLNVFAETKAANGKADLNDYGTEAYWKAYFGVEKINYYDDEFENAKTTQLSLDGSYSNGCGEAGVYFLKKNHAINPYYDRVHSQYSALVINGDVTLIFVKSDDNPNGPTLDVKGEDAVASHGAGAGIELKEGNILFVKGIGTINAKGGNGAAGGVGGNGYNGELKRVSGRADDMKAGEGGYGGYGGGGAGAGIGTKGSYGGNRVETEKNTYNTTTIGTFDKQGVQSVNGSSSGASDKVGVLKCAGNVKLNVQGGYAKENKENGGGLPGKTESSHVTGAWNDYEAAGGGGGGQGGSGFKGADIGSGGVGGASGGTGGSGSCVVGVDGAFYAYGGGGAGAGSNKSCGGLANTTQKGKYTNYAQNGTDFVPSGLGKGGNGGEGANSKDKKHQENNYGITGGNGGILSNVSGYGGRCYSVQGNASGGTDDNYVGKEAKIFKSFPVDECKIVFTDSIKDNIYKYTGSQIKPKIQIVHAPTNTVVGEKAYEIAYGTNINPEAEDNFVQVQAVGSLYDGHDFLMDKTMTRFEATITAPIEIIY